MYSSTHVTASEVPQVLKVHLTRLCWLKLGLVSACFWMPCLSIMSWLNQLQLAKFCFPMVSRKGEICLPYIHPIITWTLQGKARGGIKDYIFGFLQNGKVRDVKFLEQTQQVASLAVNGSVQILDAHLNKISLVSSFSGIRL